MSLHTQSGRKVRNSARIGWPLGRMTSANTKAEPSENAGRF